MAGNSGAFTLYVTIAAPGGGLPDSVVRCFVDTMVVPADHAESVILAMAAEVAEELQKGSNIPAQSSRTQHFENVKVAIAGDLTR